MVCMLGYCIFDITDVESVKKQVSFGYVRKDRLQNHQSTQSVGLWNESFSFDAVIYNEDGLNTMVFEDMARAKEPVWFVMPSGEALEVTINDIDITRSYFDGGGRPVKQEISFKLEAYYE